MLQLQNTFAQYDLDFEYGAELPPFIMRYTYAAAAVGSL